jgi:hypothetical protein
VKGIVVKLVLVAVALAGAFVAATWWALEAGGVARVETRSADGSTRTTHVWYVEPDGELWLEAGTPENPWYRDVLADPTVTLSAEGRSVRHRAEVVDTPAARHRVRSLLREKYGLRDRWVGLLVDSSRSVAVRLRPMEAEGR